MTDILEFRDVVRSFGRGIPVLDGVTFSMGEGEVVGLLGRNGAGKTTLVNIAMGLLYPHAGEVRVFGISPAGDPVSVKKRVGYVSEDQVLPALSTIGDVIALHRHLFPTWDAALERDLLDRFGLAGNTTRIGRLSRGQARQVALLCAVCHRPELLLLDEPAGGLDPAARREFLQTSIQLLNREGSAILFSSHQLDDVQRLGGRVVLLDQGRVRVDTGLDRLHEEYCLVVIPRSRVADPATIQRMAGCLRVRGAFENWHAVFADSPDAVRGRLGQSLGLHDVDGTRLTLEDLFIELVGAEGKATVS